MAGNAVAPAATTPGWWERTVRRGEFVAVVTVLTVAALGLGIGSALARSASSPDSVGRECQLTQPTPDEAPSEPPTSVPSVTSPDSPVVRNLTTDRQPITFVTGLDLSAEMPPGAKSLNISVGEFRRADGETLDPGQVTAVATIDGKSRRTMVWLKVCVDPVILDPTADAKGAASRIAAAAGSYTGTVLIDDPRVAGGAATYTVNLQYDRQWLVWLVAVVSWFVGAAAGVAYAAALSLSPDVTRDSKYFARAGSAVVASLGTMVTLVLTQYYDDPAWQGDVAQLIRLGIAIAGAAYVAANFAGNVGKAVPLAPAGSGRVG